MTAELATAPTHHVAHRGRGITLILLAALFFGTSGVLGKPAMQAGLSPEQVAAIRIGLSALVLLGLVAVFRPKLLRVTKREWPLLLAYGSLGVAGVQLMYFLAAGRIPVGIAILLEFTSPVLIALWVRFVRRVRLPKAMWAGIALAMTGLVLVAQVWEGLSLDVVGLLAGLGAAVCSAGYFLLGERGVADRDPLGMVTWGMTIGAVLVCAVAPPWTIPWGVLGDETAFGPWRPPVWSLLVALVLIATVLAYATGMAALRHLPASVASVVGLVEPLIAAAAAWLLLGEALSWVQAAGAVVLLTGAYIVQLTTNVVQTDSTVLEAP
ncbi:EamA family transporter [Amycolatopsis oliviviridis]|uniref:Permease n=1 Tax=Amycolatopsis oliviviridis TaxID=1471590 RepID=A0ABQ3LFM2_9PSEU|nr:EamA family transporter [Amycolatopsis oliviviridis]GHH12804.1 permease [Amycolatopsis oliviviridis]